MRRPIVSGLLVLLATVLALSASANAQEPEDTEALFAEVKKLEEEGTRWFNVAGNTDLSHDERNQARKKSYDVLKKAYGLLNDYVEAHPDQAEAQDERMVHLHYMIYWLRKESPIGLLEPADQPPAERPKDWPDKPPDDLHEPAFPGGSPRPPPPRPKTPEEVLAGIEEYVRRHPADVSGGAELYEGFIEKNPDAAPELRQRALERLAALNEMLKAAYRDLRDDDPDSLERVDEGRSIRLVKANLATLQQGPDEERILAARTLGYLGSGFAARPLVKLLERESEGPLFDAVADALARIGGRRVCERLAELGGRSPVATTVVGILSTILRRQGVEGRIAGDALATVVEHVPAELQRLALERLLEAGAGGAVGLARAVTFVSTPDTVRYLDHLGKVHDPRTAGHLASFLVANARGSRALEAAAARKAIEAMGVRAVPYLIPRLDDSRVQVWTAEMLRRITGAKPRDDRRSTWETWYRRNRSRLE